MGLRVGLDTSALLAEFKDHSIRGIGRYVFELERNLARISDPQISVGTFTQNELLGSTLNSLASFAPRARTILRQQLLLPLRLALGSKLAFDSLHFPAHMDVPIYNSHNFIVTVLDLIPIIYKELYRATHFPLKYDLARWIEKKAIQAASFVICISHNTSQDVQNLLGIPEERIAVTPLGVDQNLLQLTASPQKRQELYARFQIPSDSPTVLYVGGIDQRKNISVLLEAFAGLRRHRLEQKRSVPHLLLVGSIERDRQYPLLLQKIKALELERHCHLLGYLSDPQLFELYSNVDLFFFPSLYEGFGLTPLEAMACGCAVVSSNSSSMPEVLGDAALYFDPRSVEQASRALVELLENAALGQELRAKGRERARLFTWEKTARATLEAYRRAGELS